MTKAKVFLAGLLLLAGVSAKAESVSVTASADTVISRHSGIGGGSVPQGGRNSLSLISPPSFESFPLLRFDLTAYAGRTVQTNATLNLTYQDFFADPTMNFSIYAVSTPWDESTATWNNFVRPTSAPLLTTSINVTGTPAGTVLGFEIARSVVQGWIDSPGSNYGLFLYSGDGWSSRDINFASREYVPAGGRAGDWAPRLVFNANDVVVGNVPEPASFALLGIALAGLGMASRGRARRA